MKTELLLLDGQGVIFNRPLKTFLDTMAKATGRSPELVRQLWHQELREPFWTGRIDEAMLWTRLTGGRVETDWARQLESLYRPGPAVARLPLWSAKVPVWVLSNHRTSWLLERLRRFELDQFLERVLVSDSLGFAKPDPRVFAAALDVCTHPERVLYVDDQLANIQAARTVGFEAVLADPADTWLSRIDEFIGIPGESPLDTRGSLRESKQLRIGPPAPTQK